jgi:SAM-dependent methyltransferase
MDQKEDYRDYYESKESAEEYDEKSYGKGTYASILWEIEKNLLIKFVKSLRNSREKIRYLDFACGTGRIVAAIENLADESYGIDINQSMLDRAANKTKNTILIKGDVTKDEKIIDGYFDLITTFRFVLNAQPELRDSALKILSGRMSDNNSWLIFNMHTNKYSYAFVSYLRYMAFGQPKDKDRKRYLSKKDCLRIAKNADLDVIKIKGLGFLSGKLSRILPLPMVLFIEKSMSALPWWNLFGTDLIFFCKKKGT